MSLSERKRKPAVRLRGLMLMALAAALAGTSACTVRPLYSQGSAGAGAQAGTAALLSSIAIKPAETRVEQEVRNHLIFLFGGGAGEPANPAYVLQLGVTSATQSGASIQVADEDEPTAGIVIVTGNFRLTRAGTGEVVKAGSRQITSAFDRPRQLYASARAERDAQNRAARELAELIRLNVAQALVAAP